LLPLKDKDGNATTFCIDQQTPANQLQNPPATDLILNSAYVADPLIIDHKAELYTALKGDSWHYIAQINAPSIDRATFFKKLEEQEIGPASESKAKIQKIFLFKDVILKNGFIKFMYKIRIQTGKMAPPMKALLMKSKPRLIWPYSIACTNVYSKMSSLNV
jgi:hypothetical protein